MFFLTEQYGTFLSGYSYKSHSLTSPKLSYFLLSVVPAAFLGIDRLIWLMVIATVDIYMKKLGEGEASARLLLSSRVIYFNASIFLTMS